MEFDIDSHLISVKIDKSLAWIWDQLSLTSEEKQEKKNMLLRHLTDAYCSFVKSEYFELDKVNQNLIKAKANFRKEKDRVGDLKTFIPSHIEKLSLFEQIAFIEKLTCQLINDNSGQIQESQKQYRSLINLYDELGIPNDQRGEFCQDDGADYSSSRLIRINNQIRELQKEKTRRLELTSQLSSSIRNISNVTQEPINENVRTISNKNDISLQAINELEETHLSLMDLSKSRADQVRYYIRQIKELYSVLEIDQSKWIKFSYTPSASNVEVLEKELESLELQKEEKLPLIISRQENEVSRLSDMLQITKFKRPKYYGNDNVEAVKFYKDAISKLEAQVSQNPLTKSSFLENIESPGKPQFSNPTNPTNFELTKTQQNNTSTMIGDQSKSATIVGNQFNSTSIISAPIKSNTSTRPNHPGAYSEQELTSTLFARTSKTPAKTNNHPHEDVLEDDDCPTSPTETPSVKSPTQMSKQERHKIYLMSRDPFYA